MKKIALLPGGFKPPHAGHYNMAKWLAKNTDADVVVVKVGAKERDGITREMSLQLWNLYKESDSDPLSNKLLIQPSTSNSPVQDVYDFVENTAPEGSTVYLGMGEKDTSDSRFKNIGKFAEPRNIQFQTVLVPPQAGGVSGTEMRGFIKNNQDTFFYNSLPDHMTDMDKEDAWAIVIPPKENSLNENLDEGIRDFIKTNKDKLQNLLKNFKEAWGDQKGSFKGYKGLVQKFLNDRNSLGIEEKAKLKQNTKDLFKTAGIILTFPILGVTGNVLLAFLVDKISKGQFSNLPSQMANVVGEDLYNPEDKVLDYMKSSEWKAGMPDGPKKDINPSYKYHRAGLYGKMYEEQIEGDKANKIFVMRSPYTPKGQKWDHIGFILNDGRLRDMSGHRGSNKSPETYKYEDTEELFQMPKDKNEAIEKGLYAEKPLPKEITIPNNIACDISDPNKKAENCGSFVKIVLSNNGIETTKSNWMGDIYNSLNETVTDTDIICDNCGWTWAIVDGGDDLYICHTCGHDNTPNKMSESTFSKEWWKGHINEILNETKANTHLTHLEELILTQGQDGYNQAKSFLYELIKNLKGEDNTIKNVSVKWDGAPAIFTGINPDNGKFFVGTKSVFNKSPKINYTSQDIDVNHGHAPGLAKKLKLALQYLPPVGIQGILQGDFMFDNDDVESNDIDGTPHYTFKPNTIRYAVEANSELGKRVLSSKIGIIFHTTYKDLSGGGASFGADISGLNPSNDVWFDDAYFKDATGVLLSNEEEQEILSKINEADSINVKYNELPMEISSNAKINLLNTYLNSEVRKGEFISDPFQSFEMFKEWYKVKFIEKAVSKYSPQNQEAKRKQFEDKLRTIESKKDIVINLFKVSKLLSEAKNIFIAKYDKAVATKHFIDNGDGTLSVTKAEGFVAVDHTESGIKLVDRLEFSKNNFNAGKPGAKK